MLYILLVADESLECSLKAVDWVLRFSRVTTSIISSINIISTVASQHMPRFIAYAYVALITCRS